MYLQILLVSTFFLRIITLHSRVNVKLSVWNLILIFCFCPSTLGIQWHLLHSLISGCLSSRMPSLYYLHAQVGGGSVAVTGGFTDIFCFLWNDGLFLKVTFGNEFI